MKHKQKIKKKTLYPHALKEFVKGNLRDYQESLGMAWHDGKIAWMSEKKEEDTEDSTTCAEATINTRYLNADFKIYPELINRWKNKKMREEDVKKIISHETAHIATAQMMDLIHNVYRSKNETHDAFETLTEIIGRLLYKLGEKK